MEKNHPDFPSSNTICLHCYQSYLLVTSDAASTTAVAAAASAAVAAAASNTKTKDNSKPKAFKQTKKAPKTFSLKRKLEILDEIDKGVDSQAAIIRRENTSKSAIFRWKADREKMRQQVDEDHRGDLTRQLKIDGLKRVKDGIYKFYELNDTMPKSLRIPLTRKFPLPPSQHIPSHYFIYRTHLIIPRLCKSESVIAAKAAMLRDKLLSTHAESPFLIDVEVEALTTFQASIQWAGKIARQAGWRSKALHGEAGSVDVELVTDDIAKLRDEIKKYDINNVYNMDETGLFYKLLPNRSYVKAKDCKTARGLKLMKAKDRVTLFVCTNANGTDKVPLCLIGKSKSPRCFNNGPPRLKYFNEAKAWSDSKVFKKWWEFFLNHIRSKTADKVLLIMDNCGPHGAELKDPQNQVIVVFLPPNVTSMYQPMDSGVIAMVKKNYRYRLLRNIFEVYEERESLREAAKRARMKAGTTGLNEGHSPHLKDVMDLLFILWNEIPASKIRNCWEKSTLVSFDQQRPTVDTTTATNDVEVVEIDAEAVEIVESEDGKDEDDEYAGTDDAMQIYQLAQKFIIADSHNTGGNNELDLVVKEMIETIKETGGDMGEVDAMVEGWISMEDNEACINELADEVNELMHVDVLLKIDEEEDDENESAVEDERIMPTSDEVVNIFSQLKSISVQVGQFMEEFGKTAEDINDAGNRLRATYRKLENKRRVRANKSSRQSFMDSFVTVQKKRKGDK